MSGFKVAWTKRAGYNLPLGIEVLIGKSTQIHAGDALVLTTNSTYTGTAGSQYPVVRPYWSGDTLSTSNGLIGVAPYDIQTDSNAKLTTLTSPVTVDTRGKLDTFNPYLNYLPVDSVSGYLRLWIFAFDPSNVFSCPTSANELANFYDVNRSMGVTASAASAPANYTIEIAPSAGAAALICEGVDTEDPQFNSANGGGRLFVSCKPTFYSRNITSGWFT